MHVSFFDYPQGEHEAEATGDQQYFLGQASDDDWAAVLQHTQRRRVRAGETAIEPGAVDRAIYIVTSGTLEAIVTEGRRARPRRVSTFETGTVVGELSFLDGRPRSALVRAVTDAELARLSLESFERLAASRPVLGRAILFDLGRILAGRLRALQATIGAEAG